MIFVILSLISILYRVAAFLFFEEDEERIKLGEVTTYVEVFGMIFYAILAYKKHRADNRGQRDYFAQTQKKPSFVKTHLIKYLFSFAFGMNFFSYENLVLMKTIHKMIDSSNWSYYVDLVYCDIVFPASVFLYAIFAKKRNTDMNVCDLAVIILCFVWFCSMECGFYQVINPRTPWVMYFTSYMVQLIIRPVFSIIGFVVFHVIVLFTTCGGSSSSSSIN